MAGFPLMLAHLRLENTEEKEEEEEECSLCQYMPPCIFMQVCIKPSTSQTFFATLTISTSSDLA